MKPLRIVRTVGVLPEQSEDAQAVNYCSVCPHPEEIHDPIAVRYCAATLDMVLSRRCICRGAMVDVSQQPESAHRFP